MQLSMGISRAVDVNTSRTCDEIKDRAHLGTTKTRFSSSRLSGEQASELMDSESKHGSALAFENNSKCHEADMQSSSLKSEISTETRLTPGNGRFETKMTKRKTHRTAGDELNTSHDSQHTTESSCSSSLALGVPVYFRNCESPIDSSSSKMFDRSPEELVTASSESGVSVQTASKAIRNGNERNGMKFSSMISKGGVEMVSIYKDKFWVIESSDSSTTKHGEKHANGQDKIIAGFDLNEDITANEPDDRVRRNFASVSYHGAIYVVAKAGIPTGRPSKPLKFKGELCWKGTAETSAFRPTTRSKNLNEKPYFCTNRRPKIDLNVDAVEDTPANDERASLSSTLQRSHSENRTKSKIPLIDLNCLYEAADEPTQLFLPPKPESSPFLDSNLDTSASLASRSGPAHWLEKRCQLLGNKTSDYTNGDSCFTRNVYLSDSSSASVHSSFNTPRFTRFLHEPSRNNVSTFVPESEVRTENLLSSSGSKIHGPRLFPFLSEDCSTGEPTHRGAWYVPSSKRKELEGRQEGYHLGYKQVNSR